MFWNDTTRYLYSDAADYGNFHQAISKVIAPYLKTTDTLLDIGCGHGFLTRMMSRKVNRCIAVDIDDAVLDYIDKANIDNITTRCGDYKTMPLPNCDVLVMSFFGRLVEDFEKFKAITNRHIITIKNTKRTVYDFKHQKPLTRETHGDIIAFCQANKIDYDSFDLTLDFGQPFRCKEDIYTFLKRYKPITQGDYEDYIDTHMQKIDHPEFIYYLPKQKNIGITIIKL